VTINDFHKKKVIVIWLHSFEFVFGQPSYPI
jgi:hypothetical protein